MSKRITKGMKWSDFTGKPHWTQTPAGKKKMRESQLKVQATKRANRAMFKDIAKSAVVRTSKRGSYRKTASKQTSLVVNGWRISLGVDEIRIDHE